jgi:alpha-beta hydrolase superfamily lysophospholipase
LIRRALIWVAVTCVAVFATLLLVQVFAERRMLDLELWHEVPPAGEFRAADAGPAFGWEAYLEIEDRLFRGLGTYSIPPDSLGGRSPILRFVRGGRGDPATFERNWNRTTELLPGEISGGVLLLHGLTDSPYSMRSLATFFQGEGFYALCPRLPGHGTVPAGLLEVSWKDWMAAVRLAARHVRERVGPGKPIYLCGYSTGGGLAILQTLEALAGGDVLPDRLFLFSPAIGVTAFARASNWHKAYSWIPGFEKSKWLSVEPEYDPFKYNSFPKNAGAQVWELTKEIQREIERAGERGRLDELPPVTTFQSTVDSTIVAAAVASGLYEKLPPNGSELVVFDVNRLAVLDGFYGDPRTPLEEMQRDPSLPFVLTVVENAGADSPAVVARTRAPSSREIREEPLGLEWPRQVYSLAHVAIPFPPDDPLYGEGAADASGSRVHLGDLSLRGEKNVLVVSATDLMRLRHNPFHSYMIEKIRLSIRRH